jgi:hypothetical protein
VSNSAEFFQAMVLKKMDRAGEIERLRGALHQASFCLRELLPDNADAQMTVRMIANALSASLDDAKASTECCDVPIAGDQRYCPKCGWEARRIPAARPEVSVVADARRSARELAMKMLTEMADHVADNSAALRKYAGEENEARCRELAGTYLRECVSILHMEQKMDDLSAAVDTGETGNG